MALVRQLLRFIRHPFIRKHVSQGWRFAVCGLLGLTVDLVTLTFLVETMGLEPDVAYAPSVLFAVIFVFLGNKFFTFRDARQQYVSQVTKFAIVYGAAIVLNIFISTMLFWSGVQYQLAKVFAIAFGALWNYTLSHLFIFRRDEPDAAIV